MRIPLTLQPASPSDQVVIAAGAKGFDGATLSCARVGKAAAPCAALFAVKISQQAAGLQQAAALLCSLSSDWRI